MSHNPIRAGEMVILDEDMLTAREVKVLHITKNKHFAIVSIPGQEWHMQVMMSRLSRKTPLNTPHEKQDKKSD